MIYNLTVNDGKNTFSCQTCTDFEIIKFISFLSTKDFDVDLPFELEEEEKQGISVDMNLLSDCMKGE